jgi:hypothetical protein
MRFRYQISNFCTVLQIISTMVLIFFSKSCTSYSFVPIHHCFSADVCTCKLLQIHNCWFRPCIPFRENLHPARDKNTTPKKLIDSVSKIHIETKFTTTGGSSAERPFGISGLLTRTPGRINTSCLERLGDARTERLACVDPVCLKW